MSEGKITFQAGEDIPIGGIVSVGTDGKLYNDTNPIIILKDIATQTANENGLEVDEKSFDEAEKQVEENLYTLEEIGQIMEDGINRGFKREEIIKLIIGKVIEL